MLRPRLRPFGVPPFEWPISLRGVHVPPISLLPSSPGWVLLRCLWVMFYFVFLVLPACSSRWSVYGKSLLKRKFFTYIRNCFLEICKKLASDCVGHAKWSNKEFVGLFDGSIKNDAGKWLSETIDNRRTQVESQCSLRQDEKIDRISRFNFIFLRVFTPDTSLLSLSFFRFSLSPGYRLHDQWRSKSLCDTLERRERRTPSDLTGERRNGLQRSCFAWSPFNTEIVPLNHRTWLRTDREQRVGVREKAVQSMVTRSCLHTTWQIVSIFGREILLGQCWSSVCVLQRTFRRSWEKILRIN